MHENNVTVFSHIVEYKRVIQCTVYDTHDKYKHVIESKY